MSATTVPRSAQVTRSTRETSVECRVVLDGSGAAEVSTGIGFLDHMVASLALHSRIDVSLTCRGDLEVDDHHTAEDCALALGQAIDAALGERRGIGRFGWALVPLDEALAQVALDLSGRPFARVELELVRERIGALATENATHFLQSLAVAMRATLHVDVLRGANDHHKVEAAFKATARCLRQAVAADPLPGEFAGETNPVPSAKGSL
ncbi:imidazoleglycerol-phosphate dehydratase HisB [Engelhardtia mirabilis]|uniref:Imidazoleglycerol-phosphate dehydratase n=1 Tax=Engelhardtia mirabilis TaxID=2528011 RepID=A0A518BI41_9BACT|nr:Histidine biosynthesis bifunctional protein HisB [Planctomycetes bacterium Pla133]QDV00950.1 Histidine biosynthesis bifunctional protein HisB [Planctomycetes bacterium Pla86]